MSITQTPDVFEKLAPKRQQIAYGLMGLGAALAAIPIANAALYRWQSLAFLLWGAALTLLVEGIGIYYLVKEPAGTLREEADRLRILTLILLGGAGLLTAILGFVLPFCSSPLTVTDYWSIFAGGVGKWRERENVAPLIRCASALIGGLVLMFLGLLQARVFERTSPNLRRLLYGYNAVLSSLLLVLIMILVNMLPYARAWPFSYANESIDWTRTGLHSLHEATINLVAGLKQPVKVYALGSSNDQIMRDTTDMLERCRNINPQYFTWEQLSRDRNSTDLRELIAKYSVPDSRGVLVVYGTEKKEVNEFIRYDDLFKVSPNPKEPRYEFKGENALLNALAYVTADRSRARVYFTQGNGELNFKDPRGDAGLGRLIEELGRINYETAELPVNVDTNKIPDEAEIVVIARPARPFPDKFVSALRDYLHGKDRKDGKKGKLIVLFDVVTEGGKGAMVKTGLEGLVGEYGIRVQDNQVVNLTSRDYLGIRTVPDPSSSNAIAKAFYHEREGTLSSFYFYKVRTLESSAANTPGAPPASTPETVILTLPQQLILVQSDLSANTGAWLEELSKDQQKLQDQISRKPLTLAMAVSEGKTPVPFPGHEFAAKEGQPRLVVFGDASWISNEYLLRPSPNNYQLFASCLSWLAERADIGARVPPTEHDIYELKAPPGSGLRLLLLPGFLMVLGVVALGVGVWVVRRR
jgi:hypothetical protein